MLAVCSYFPIFNLDRRICLVFSAKHTLHISHINIFISFWDICILFWNSGFLYWSFYLVDVVIVTLKNQVYFFVFRSKKLVVRNKCTFFSSNFFLFFLFRQIGVLNPNFVKAAARSCSAEELIWKMCKIHSTFVRVTCYQSCRPATLLKERLRQRYFPVRLTDFVQQSFMQQLWTAHDSDVFTLFINFLLFLKFTLVSLHHPTILTFLRFWR